MKRVGHIPGNGRSVSLDASSSGTWWFMGGDLNGFCDIRPFMKWRGWGMLSQGPFETILQKLHIHIYHTSNFKTICPVVTRTHPDKIWADFGMPFWSLWLRHFKDWILCNSLAQLHTHIYQISKFQTNPSSGYWEENLCGENVDRKKKKKK